MKVGDWRRIGAAAVVLASLFNSAGAQGVDFDQVRIETIEVADGLYILMGGPAQGNIAVLTGDEGMFLVDSMYAPMHDKIADALARISSGPVRYLVNTHLHGDHTAGNAAIGDLGAVVIAHENTRDRMASQLNDPQSSGRLPVLTYSESMTLHLNGEEIFIYNPGQAHTDGDSIIYFRNANVVHVGDIPSSLRYPNIGVNDGGTVDGMMAAARQLMEIVNEDTKIVPGHLGPVVGFDEIRAQLEMFQMVRDRVAAAIRDGQSLEEVVASKPTADFDQTRLAGAITPDRFVTLVYTDLARSAQ